LGCGWLSGLGSHHLKIEEMQKHGDRDRDRYWYRRLVDSISLTVRKLLSKGRKAGQRRTTRRSPENPPFLRSRHHPGARTLTVSVPNDP